MRTLLFSCLLGVAAHAAVTPYRLTALNTPATGASGEIVSVQACSTNSVSTATVSSVTEISVGGTTYPFTNQLVTVSVTNGTANWTGEGAYVAPKQKLVLTGDFVPGGSMIIWVRQ